jgi:hypothetical protein
MPGLRAAVAASERVQAGLAWEWTQLDLTPRNWRDAVDRQTVDLLLLEISAGKVPGWGAAGPAEFKSLIDWAVQGGVPIVAWVTGGHADVDVAEPWIDSVAHVFVDRDDLVEVWKSRWPQVAVGVLGPAAQPRLQNPRNGGPGRRREPAAAVIVHGESPALEALTSVVHDHVDLWPVAPEVAAGFEGTPLQQSMISGRRIDPRSPTLSRYRVLGVVGAAETQSSWSIVEAASAQTAIVVDGSGENRVPADIREFVSVADVAEEFRHDIAARCWQEELRDREGVQLSRSVWDGHTYARRVDQITAALRIPNDRKRRTVSVVVPTNRTYEFGNVLDNLSRQEHVTRGLVELILVLHGLEVNARDLRARARDVGIENVTTIEADRSHTLGACMNMGLDAAGGDLIAKMDDDNYYGRYYLTDLMAAFDYTDAGIVGKWAHYVWLRSTGAVILRCRYAEHRYDRLVQGGSMLMKADVAHAVRFGDKARGVDTDFLDRARLAGVLTYSADRFNYVSIRGIDRNAHTWTIADTAMMNKAGALVFYGDPRPHVNV